MTSSTPDRASLTMADHLTSDSPTVSRRALAAGAAAGGMTLLAHGGLVAQESGAPATPPATGADERAYLVDVLTTVARPVLEAAAAERLHEDLPVRDWEGGRAYYSPLEALARTLAGIAPWLELGPDESPEGQLRAEFIELTRQSLINATNPESPDFMTFDESEGLGPQPDQPLVEGAYLAYAIMNSHEQLWEPLSDEQKANVVNAFYALDTIELTHFNNWVLFPAMVHSALRDLRADFSTDPVAFAVDQMEEWYLGDGVYGDGPEFHADYYNSFVIHPMLLECLRIAEERGSDIADDSVPRAWERAERYAEILERLISPEGTFPVIGRSQAYRFASMYHLAHMALRGALPETLEPGAVRSGITAIVRNMIEAPGTFDEQGWLRLGVVGYQPGVQEHYNATGSLYACLTGLVHLGLPADDPFWTAPAEDWTQKRIWAGDPTIGRDESL